MAGIYLAIGSNLGNRQANLTMALRMLAPLVRVEAVSSLYESLPAPPAPPPSYLNAACRVVTGLGPQLLLRHVKRVEHLLGRRPGERWGPRPIDIDIALYDDVILDEPELVIPHPRLDERAFVLRPLLDLDAALVHPATGERLDAALARVGNDGLTLFADAGWQLTPISPR